MLKEQFHGMTDQLKQAWADNNMEAIQDLAHQYLAWANEYQSDWNYGNAIHQANIFLGLLSLRKGQLPAAKEYLIAAAKSKGSPTLNTFGPDMALAKQLLENGERDIVINYLDLVKKFWWKVFSFFKIRKWKREIKNGVIPNFGGNLIYVLGAPS